MSTALEQKQQLDALFTRANAFMQRIEDFKAAYETHVNPTVQIIQHPVESEVQVSDNSLDIDGIVNDVIGDSTPSLSGQFESVKHEATAVNDIISDIDIDGIINSLDIDDNGFTL